MKRRLSVFSSLGFVNWRTASHLDASRHIIEREIAKVGEGSDVVSAGETETFQSRTIESTAIPRRDQAINAIDTFHRAEAGDPQAKEDLLDAKKELLGEEPSDDDIFQIILETQSGNPFAQDTVLEVMLSDEQAQAHQDVLDMFKEFRGDLASVDEAIKPAQQIELFIELTKGGGTLAERMFFVRKVLTVLTANGERNLFEGLTNLHVLNGGEVLKSGVDKLKELTERRALTA